MIKIFRLYRVVIERGNVCVCLFFVLVNNESVIF